MSYMHCPSCGLRIRLRAPFLTLDRCPRCLARRGVAIPMQISEGRSRAAPADDAASASSGTHDETDARGRTV
jgi:hypothetical protein